MQPQRDQFGTRPLGILLRQQAIPASVGILTLSIYGIVDTIFVGRFVGSLGIAAITVVLPITFLIASIGMAVGVGGASIISRSFGEKNEGKAFRTFGNQVVITLSFALFFVLMGFVFQEQILALFGGRGDAQQPSAEYFGIILYGIPFLAMSMMFNNVIRAEGFPKVAMFTLIVPAVINMIFDPIFIIWLDMGITGAAWATTLSYVGSTLYALWFFMGGKSQMQVSRKCFLPDVGIIREIAAIGSVTLARQGTISVLAMVLNNSLFSYGGEMALSVYGIISRMMMFANFPVYGITQGFVPIVGYNYGADLMDRVREVIRLAIRSATAIAFLIFILIMVFSSSIASVFTTNSELISQATPAIRFAFLATPLLAISLLGSAYFQAIGRALPALMLTLTKQGFFLIPLVLILPAFFGINGIWFSFPLADIGSAAITWWYLKKKIGGRSGVKAVA